MWELGCGRCLHGRGCLIEEGCILVVLRSGAHSSLVVTVLEIVIIVLVTGDEGTAAESVPDH